MTTPFDGPMGAPSENRRWALCLYSAHPSFQCGKEPPFRSIKRRAGRRRQRDSRRGATSSGWSGATSSCPRRRSPNHISGRDPERQWAKRETTEKLHLTDPGSYIPPLTAPEFREKPRQISENPQPSRRFAMRRMDRRFRARGNAVTRLCCLRPVEGTAEMILDLSTRKRSE